MDSFIKPLTIRWSDLDPNFHLRHSVYYDFGAYCRVSFLDERELTAGVMAQHHIGPILFREECIFRREIKLGDTIAIDLRLTNARGDYSRWSIQHHIYKDGEILAAVLSVDGAWMDTHARKLATPPGIATAVFAEMPRDESFEWLAK